MMLMKTGIVMTPSHRLFWTFTSCFKTLEGWNENLTVIMKNIVILLFLFVLIFSLIDETGGKQGNRSKRKKEKPQRRRKWLNLCSFVNGEVPKLSTKIIYNFFASSRADNFKVPTICWIQDTLPSSWCWIWGWSESQSWRYLDHYHQWELTCSQCQIVRGQGW